jgi:hypothetical protein
MTIDSNTFALKLVDYAQLTLHLVQKRQRCERQGLRKNNALL